jgi:hypothetical protein
MYQNDPLKVLTGECRLSYCHLDKPYANSQGAEPKYGVTLLIPKTDVATKAEIDQAMQAAIAEGVSKTWNGQRPAMPAIPLYDGDGRRANGEAFGPECKGHWVMTASCKSDRKPQVVHISNIHSELAPSDIYSGMFGRVTIRFFTYSNSGKRGVGCGLGNVLKTRDGEPLAANRADAEDDFAGLEQSAPAAGYPGAAPYQPVPPYGYPAPGTTGAPVMPQINPFTGQPM